MMRINFLIVFFLLASNSFAQDCSSLKENEEYRLDKNNGPLVNSRIQDQDGIGTCYANTSSVALQTALSGNPNVSYLQLAFSHAQINIAPENKGRNSAYRYSDDNEGKKGESLIDGGRVCETIEAAKSDKIGGVCSRDDVALEKSLFNPKTNNSTDSLNVQKQIIAAVSDYYDSIKDKFGINPSATKEEIANRTLAFTNYKHALGNMIRANQMNFPRKVCLKPDLTNALKVYKNLIAKQYIYFKNKYGEDRFSRSYEKVRGKTNPDLNRYLYYLHMGGVSSGSSNELKINVDEKIIKTLEKNYIEKLLSPNPPKDAIIAFRSALMKVENQKDAAITNKLITGLGPADIELLQKDYHRYVKKDLAECMRNNSNEYYKNDDGFIKDYANDSCLKNYLPQGKNFQSLLNILDKDNLSNIKAINTFINKLPTASYEEAMRAIVAPECSDDQKIKIPSNLKCESKNFNYTSELRNKLVSDKKMSYMEIDDKIKAEEEKEKQQILSAKRSESIVIENKYAGKTDRNSIESKKTEYDILENKTNVKMAKVHSKAAALIPRQLMGEKEQDVWNNYISSTKENFNNDAIHLLKNEKQAIPLTLCTRVFNSPNAAALRDGRCDQDSADGNYQSVGGIHSVAVIGVRCQKGKFNYLIQNSWGDWDSIKNAKNANGTQHFEHEYGKAWMSADELMNNFFDYQKITK